MNIASAFTFWIVYLEALEQEREESRRKGSLVEVTRYIALRGIVPRSLLFSRYRYVTVRNALYYLRLVDAVMTNNELVISTPLIINLERLVGERWLETLAEVAHATYRAERGLLIEELKKIEESMAKLRSSPWKALVEDIHLKARVDKLVEYLKSEICKLYPQTNAGVYSKEYSEILGYAMWLLDLVADVVAMAARIQTNNADIIKNYLESYKKFACSTFDKEDLRCKSLNTLLTIYKEERRHCNKLNGEVTNYIYNHYVEMIERKIKNKQGRYNARSVLKAFLQATWEFLTTV